MRSRFVFLGSLATGLLASACCIGPLVLGVMGLGSLGFAAALQPFRPYFLGLTGLFLLGGFYLAYRPLPKGACRADGSCEEAPSRRGLRTGLWVVTALSIVLATYPNWSVALSRSPSVSPVMAGTTELVTLEVAGMTCQSCAGHIQSELQQVPGVVSAEVSYEDALARIQVESPAPATELLLDAVARAGYKANQRTDAPEAQ